MFLFLIEGFKYIGEFSSIILLIIGTIFRYKESMTENLDLKSRYNTIYLIFDISWWILISIRFCFKQQYFILLICTLFMIYPIYKLYKKYPFLT